MPERDFLYAAVATDLRPFVTDDNRFGLHLTMADGESLDVVFHNPRAFKGLQALGAFLQQHLPKES